MDTIEFGDKVKDIVTEFEGIAIGINIWMTGCKQIAVQPSVIKDDGSLSSATWFDESRLEIVAKKYKTFQNQNTISMVNRNGGPQMSY